MLFSKLKSKSDDILPPPPPFPSMELEKDDSKKHSRDDDFESLASEVRSISPKSAKAPKPKPAKQKKVLVTKPKKSAPNVTLPKLDTGKKPHLKVRHIKPEKDLELDFALPDEKLDFDIPEIGKDEKIEMPDTLEDLEIGNELDVREFGGEQHDKPVELLEAEEEIKSAIDSIRQSEKPSLFRKLFGKRKLSETIQPSISSIQTRISSARQALMKFDLEAAKRDYIEIMRIYNNIKPEDQAKVYHDVKDLYFERKSAEGINA